MKTTIKIDADFRDEVKRVKKEAGHKTIQECLQVAIKVYDAARKVK